MTGEDLKKLVDPGDIIEFDMGTYSHFGIYVGDQELSPAGSSTGPDVGIKKGDLVHLTKEDNEVVLEYLSEQKNRCRKNNLKDDEEAPKDKNKICEDALEQVGARSIYHLGKYNCEHFSNDMRYGIPVSDQIDGVKEAFDEVVELLPDGVPKLVTGVLSEYCTTASPSRNKSRKFSEIISMCPDEAFEDFVFKDTLKALKMLKEKVDKAELELTFINFVEGIGDRIKKIFQFKTILMEEPSTYLMKKKMRKLLNPDEILELDSPTKKVLMVLIMVFFNLEETSTARRASLMNLFSILRVSTRKRTSVKRDFEDIEAEEVYKKLKF